MMDDRPVAALVGREDCLGDLSECLSGAAGGRPRIVVVSGETGVGKTRLVGEFVRRAPARALVGACVPVAGEALPFAPLAQALRRLRPDSDGGDLDAYPDLRHLVCPDDGAPAGRTHQLGFFQSVLGLLGDLGRARPVVLVVEDIHWADRSTLDLVRFLATNLADERVLVVLTYRADQVTGASAVRMWLAELGRLPRVEHLRLPRLDPGQTRRLVEALAGPGLDPGLAQTIVARADGNPLFTQHLVWHSSTDGAGMPIALSDLLEARLSCLPEATRSLVSAASVLARRTSPTTLAATAGMSVEAVEDALVPALDGHVLRLTDDDRIDFHHPAFREVAYHALLPTRRARLHRAAARALEDTVGSAVPGGGPADGRASAGEIARHWHLAGDLPRALDSALAAAFAAERIYAFADAHAHFLRVLDLLERVDAQVDRIEVLRHAARSARVLGDHDEAVRLLGVALAADLPDGLRCAVLEELAYAHAVRGHGPATEAALREALGLLAPGERSVLAAKVHAGLATHAAAYSQFDQAERECAVTLELAVAVGARREEGRARNALGLVAAAHGDHDGAARELREALAVARESGSPDGVCDAYINLSHVLGEAGRHREVVEVARIGLEELTRLGVMQQTGTILLANAAESQFRLGRYDEAAALVGRSLRYGSRGMVAAPTLCRAAQVDMVRGEFEAAVGHCDHARAIVEVERAPLGWVREVAEISAEAELWAGRPEAAYGVVMAGLEAIADTDEERRCALLYCLGLRALGDLADSRRNESARRTRRHMRADLAQLAAARPTRDGADDPPATTAWIATAAAESSRAAGHAEPDLWVEVEREWRVLQRPLETAYAAWRQAESRLARGVDAAGIHALRAAAALAGRFRIVPLVQDVDRLARWHRIEVLPEEAPGAGRSSNGVARGVTANGAPVNGGTRIGPDPIDPAPSVTDELSAEYGLTPREVEVLRGLTEGRTNQEIGRALGISPKTASVHVSNILRKLDVTGRAQAARVGHGLGVWSDLDDDAGSWTTPVSSSAPAPVPRP